MPEAASDGALAIRPLGKNKLSVICVSGMAPFVIKRPYQVHGACITCEAFDCDGKAVPEPEWHDNGYETQIKPRETAIHYRLTFGRRIIRAIPSE